MTQKGPTLPTHLAIEAFAQALAAALKRICAEQQTEAPASTTQLPVALQPQSTSKEQIS